MKYASASAKALPLALLLITLTLSLILFLTCNRTYIGNFPNALKDHRNVAQVIVQILSTTLSLAQMLVITSLINFAARIRLFKSPTSLGSLSFWSALSIPRFDRTLPPIKLVSTVFVLVFGTVLGGLWAGSLTPLLVTTSRDDGRVLVPCFNTTLAPTIYTARDNGGIVLQCKNNETADPRGPSYPPLDNCIVMNKLGSLIMTAATATNVTDPKQHSKIDNSTWTYKGRSYGKGALAGLFEVSNTTLHAKDIGFSFQESGYNIQASCKAQNATILPFRQEDKNTTPGQLNLWVADTVILDSGNISIPPFHLASPTFNTINSQAFGYFAWSAFVQDGVHLLATSSQNGSWSDDLNPLLCTIEFNPWIFSVNVSTIEQLVTVTPLNKIETFDQSGNIADMILIELDLVSRMSSSSLVFSSLYNALTSNLAASQLAYPDVDNGTKWEYTLRDAITAIADDFLTYHGILAISGGRNTSISQPAQRHFSAVKIGQRPYQIAQLVVNVILCTICLWEACRTRYWKHLPYFDFVDSKALALAALGAGRSNDYTSMQTPFSSVKWRENDQTKVVAFYDEQSGASIRFSDGTGEGRRLVSRTESSLNVLDDHGSSQDRQFTTQDSEGMDFPQAFLLSPLSSVQRDRVWRTQK